MFTKEDLIFLGAVIFASKSTPSYRSTSTLKSSINDAEIIYDMIFKEQSHTNDENIICS